MFFIFSYIMGIDNSLFPIDQIEELKNPDWGLYEAPSHGVPSKINWFYEPPLVVWIDERILNNLADTNEQGIEDKVDNYEEEVVDEFIPVIKDSWDIDIIIGDWAASFCTWDQMYAWLDEINSQ